MSTKLQAPEGKTRVVGVDLFDHSDYLVGDYNTPEEALKIANDRNGKRNGPMNDVCYIYDDQGRRIPSHTGKVSP